MAVPLRHELKFFISPIQYQVLSRTLKATLNPDPNGDENNQYHIRSLYFDTAYDSALYDKINGTANRDKYRMDDVALICQSFNLFPLLTVLENVMYPMTLRGISAHKAKETAKEKLAAVVLDETYYKRLPDMLSGGEQQRVAIARALASDAKVLLADEPTGNLDTENGKNIIDILKTLAREQGYCVIVVTHDLGIAAEADEVLHLSDGMVKAE